MYKKEVTLEGISGIHARPAAVLVKESSKYSSNIEIIKDGQEYNAKSIMSVLSMGIVKGDKIIIKAEGEDEKEAVESLVYLIKNKSRKL